MAKQPAALVWFRQDLRLHDNPALRAAIESGTPVLPVYILDDQNAGPWAMGAASRWWLHHSLKNLNQSLSGRLAIYRGDARIIIPALAQNFSIQNIYWNRCYEPWRIARDTEIKATLEDDGVTTHSYNASLLYEPWQVKKDDGTPYRVFTPFFRRGCVGRGEPALPVATPPKFALAERPSNALECADLDLLPKKIRWDQKMEPHWSIGEDAARTRLDTFLDEGLADYKQDRNRPDRPHKVSRLSPHLHFGEISPRTVWHSIRQRMIAEGLENDGDNFLSELGWREFSYSLLYFNPTLPTEPLQSRFKSFPWDQDDKALLKWQQGQTGYPIVDAGMRELWETGYMHNRVRMIVGSFLVKDLRLHWTAGEKWFWDCLVDADLASNAASWQWIAGCGADAAPYFRVFNPVGQGEKFDPDGDYVRRYVPELAGLPNDLIHRPWEAPPMLLKQAGVTLGGNYPLPMVDHKEARLKALEAFQATKVL